MDRLKGKHVFNNDVESQFPRIPSFHRINEVVWVFRLLFTSQSSSEITYTLTDFLQ